MSRHALVALLGVRGIERQLLQRGAARHGADVQHVTQQGAHRDGAGEAAARRQRCRGCNGHRGIQRHPQPRRQHRCRAAAVGGVGWVHHRHVARRKRGCTRRQVQHNVAHVLLPRRRRHAAVGAHRRHQRRGGAVGGWQHAKWRRQPQRRVRRGVCAHATRAACAGRHLYMEARHQRHRFVTQHPPCTGVRVRHGKARMCRQAPTARADVPGGGGE